VNNRSWLSCSSDTLSTPDSRVSENRQIGTNEWFLKGQTFCDWRAGNPKALWLHGEMGCGKTWLMTTIDEKLRFEAGPKDQIATCYLSNAPATTDIRSVICSLLSQLGMRKKLHSALYDLHTELEKRPLVSNPTTPQLQETPIKVLAPGGSDCQTFILVDALDEILFRTMHDARAKIVELPNTLASSQTPALHLLMTSRPHEDLVKSFTDPQAAWSVFPMPAENLQADIELYVRSKITRLAKDLNISAPNQIKLISRLSGPKQTM
jgi:hypothetical protein